MKSALAISLLLVACGDDGAIKPPDAAEAADANLAVDAAPPRETIKSSQLLEPGELVEGIMTGGPADLAQLKFSAVSPEIDWNIHAHPSGTTITVYEQFDQMTVDYAFVPSEQADWYLLLKNSGPTTMTIEVEVGLYGNMQWRWE